MYGKDENDEIECRKRLKEYLMPADPAIDLVHAKDDERRYKERVRDAFARKDADDEQHLDKPVEHKVERHEPMAARGKRVGEKVHSPSCETTGFARELVACKPCRPAGNESWTYCGNEYPSKHFNDAIERLYGERCVKNPAQIPFARQL